MQVPELVNRAEFRQQVLESADPVAVAFLGNNEESIKLGPTLDALAAEFAGRAEFFWINATSADLLDADWRIRPADTPMVILFVDGRPTKRWGNEHNPDEYRRELQSVLAQIWGG